jgi:hypothetical protein
MYRNLATVAYAQAYSVAKPSITELLSKSGRSDALERIFTMRQALWTGVPDEAMPEDTGSASFSIDAGDQDPAALVTMSPERTLLDFPAVESDAAVESASADALLRASDPSNGTPLSELASIAAARLLLHAEPARGASRAAFSGGLTFEVARRSIISSGIREAESDALRTFFALADQDDLVNVFSLLKENTGKEATEASVSQMVYSAAARIFSGSRGIFNDTELLAIVILGRPVGSPPPAARDAALAQRLIFDVHLMTEEPSFALEEATFDPAAVGITVGFTITGGDLNVSCRLSSGAAQSHMVARSETSASFRFPGPHTAPIGYACWSIYGTFAQGELAEQARPSAAEDASEGEGIWASELCKGVKVKKDRLIPPDQIDEAKELCAALADWHELPLGP